ncbi:MAG: presqualene diphosphate synthase HpnD [Bauldia litoralis]
MTDAAPATDFEAQDYVRQVVEASGTSFMTAMRILPEERRDAMYAIYAFCRDIDDIADDEAPAADKIARLKSWRKEIDRLYDAEPQSLTARALVRHVRAYDLQRQDFIDLIEGMEMDAVEDIRAPSLEKLDRYCDRVASAVGRLSVRAFGSTDDRASQVAHHLGRALQLTNILRDLREDADRGRLYLPAELLEARGISERDPDAVLAHLALPEVCRDLARIARDHYASAAWHMRHCKRGPMRPARLMMQAYKAILNALTRRGWKRIDDPVELARWRKIWIALRYGLI